MRESSVQVSVIVPSYQHERFVVSALRSVLEQTGVTFEVIAIDDGSQDGSFARIEQVDDSRLVASRQQNRGLSRTLNRGLERARGRWVKMLPSDDLLEPDALARQVAVAEADDLAVVFSLPTVIDQDDRPLSDPGPQAWFDIQAEDSRDLLRALVRRNPLCAPGALFDRELALRVGGFDPSLRVAQDYDLWLRLLPRGAGRLLADRLVRVRWHGANQSATTSPSTEAERAYALIGALVRCGLERWAERFAPQGRAQLAVALLQSGLGEVRPFARAALAAARAHGESLGAHRELEAFLREAPELARAGDWGGFSSDRRTWDR